LYSEQANQGQDFQIFGAFWLPAYRSLDTAHAQWPCSSIWRELRL